MPLAASPTGPGAKPSGCDTVWCLQPRNGQGSWSTRPKRLLRYGDRFDCLLSADQAQIECAYLGQPVNCSVADKTERDLQIAESLLLLVQGD